MRVIGIYLMMVQTLVLVTDILGIMLKTVGTMIITVHTEDWKLSGL